MSLNCSYVTFLLLVGVFVSLGSGKGTCGLECWLNNIQIDVPPVVATSDVLEASVNISGMVCQNITLRNISSAYNPPSSYYLYGSGIGIICAGDWAISQRFVGIIASGTVSFVVLDSFLGFTIEFYTGPNGLISHASVDNCNCGFQIQQLDFNTDEYLARLILDTLNNTIKGLIEYEVKNTFCNLLTTFVQNNSTQYFQLLNNLILPYIHPGPPPPPPVVPPGMTNLSSSAIIELGQYFLNHVIGINGVLNINTIMNQFTPDGEFSYYFNKSINVTVDVPNYGKLTFGLISLNVGGLNTWSQFSVLNNVEDEPYLLKSQTGLDKFNISVNFSVQVELTGSIIDDVLYETGNLFMSVSNTNLTLESQVGMIERMMYNEFTAPNNIMQDPLSLLIPIKSVDITDLQIWMDLDVLNITSLSGDIEYNFDEAIDNLFLLLISQYKDVIPAVFNGFLGGPVREGSNEYVNESLAPYKDLNVTDETQYSFGFNQFVTILAASSATGLFLIIFFILCGCSKSSTSEEDQYQLLKAENYQCIAISNHIPIFLRYGIPFLILGNIALFVSANTGTGAVVYVQLTFNGTQVQTPSLFSFSLANSIDDMWQAQVYALSLLIAVFSGAWPYLKLVLMLVSWIVPTKLLSARHREYVIMVLDALGKWSLIDAYVLTLMIVAFRFRLAPEEIHSKMDVIVEPDWGFYSFLMATMISLILTHLILASHRKIMKEQKRIQGESIFPTEPNIVKKRKSLCTIAFTKKDSTLQYIAPIFITLLLILSICLLIIGSYWISFEFQFQGAAALALSYLSQSTNQPYSLITLGLSLPSSSSNPNSVGIRLIQVTFFLFALVIPLFLLICLLFLWIVPLSRKFQRRLYVLTEILNAWSAIDVFVISIIASLLEISQFAQFIIGDRCDTINIYLAEYLNEALQGVDKCFDVITKLDTGCWLLFGGCITYILSSIVVMRACHRALSNRDKEENITQIDTPPKEGEQNNNPPESIQ